ncbi:ABC transporter ATP-binding protein [Metabacillus sp. FJAT-52054]|uniref:ABC transporter ATP-binding protein n=1 Tax=Metabacillus sediminis TaxID=3117746 RepID=A0ABZ2NFG3_9BACI
MSNILVVDQVSRSIKNQLVTDNVSFSIGTGEIVGLAGPNGAGKTTLMRMITGLIKNYEGEILLNNRSVKTGKKFSRKEIGCVIEAPGYYPNMTGYENLQFFGALTKSITKEEIFEAAELTEIKDALNKKVKHYSMGMKQRLGIAQALIGDPKLLVLDEPTNGLDPSGMRNLRNYLKVIAETKKIAMLISSHSLDEIEKICERVIVLNNGKVVKTLHLTETEQDTVFYVFESNDEMLLTAYLEEEGYEPSALSQNRIRIQIKKEQVQALISKIAERGIGFSSVYEWKESLETQYFELTERSEKNG